MPLVQAGVTEEKAEIGARIHWTGVGVRLGTTRPEPAAVRSGVRRVLDDPSYRRAAGRIRQEMSSHDAGREGAALLQQLADPAAGALRRPSGALTAQVGGTGSVTWAQRSTSTEDWVRRRSRYQATPPTAAPMATIIFHCTTPP